MNYLGGFAQIRWILAFYQELTPHVDEDMKGGEILVQQLGEWPI